MRLLRQDHVKPRCLGLIPQLSHTCHVIALNMICTTILPSTKVTFTGLQLPRSSLQPFTEIRVTLASLQSSGTPVTDQDHCWTVQSCLATTSASSLSALRWILAGPIRCCSLSDFLPAHASKFLVLSPSFPVLFAHEGNSCSPGVSEKIHCSAMPFFFTAGLPHGTCTQPTPGPLRLPS